MHEQLIQIPRQIAEQFAPIGPIDDEATAAYARLAQALQIDKHGSVGLTLQDWHLVACYTGYWWGRGTGKMPEMFGTDEDFYACILEIDTLAAQHL